jgi:hypothetical protein
MENFGIANTGGVLFVDILGISELTGYKSDELEDVDFTAWKCKKHMEKSKSRASYLSAFIVAEFRTTLRETKEELEKIDPECVINISQASDCAFISSENLYHLLVYSTRMMQKMIQNGVLCRGGIAYGHYMTSHNIEENKNSELGNLIIGPAATRATKLEGSLGVNGAMLSCEPNLLDEYYNHYKNAKEQSEKDNRALHPHAQYDASVKVFHKLFDGLKIGRKESIEYQNFQWYSKQAIEDFNLHIEPNLLLEKLTKNPRFRWNNDDKKNTKHFEATRKAFNEA